MLKNLTFFDGVQSSQIDLTQIEELPVSPRGNIFLPKIRVREHKSLSSLNCQQRMENQVKKGKFEGILKMNISKAKENFMRKASLKEKLNKSSTNKVPKVSRSASYDAKTWMSPKVKNTVVTPEIFHSLKQMSSDIRQQMFLNRSKRRNLKMKKMEQWKSSFEGQKNHCFDPKAQELSTMVISSQRVSDMSLVESFVETSLQEKYGIKRSPMVSSKLRIFSTRKKNPKT